MSTMSTVSSELTSISNTSELPTISSASSDVRGVPEKAAIVVTHEKFIELLNHLAFAAQQTPSVESTSYGFIGAILFHYNTTLIHDRAALGCIPQGVIGTTKKGAKVPDFINILCSYTSTRLNKAHLRSWWEGKCFPGTKTHLVTSERKITESFAEMFKGCFTQLRDQTSVAFDFYPGADQFYIMLSSGLRFALLEWPNPRKLHSRPSTWEWVEQQEKATVKAFNNKNYMYDSKLIDAQHILDNTYSGANYAQLDDAEARRTFRKEKQQLRKALNSVKDTLDCRSFPRLLYYCEPMFTTSHTANKPWDRITGLTPQFRTALHMLSTPPHSRASELSFSPSFFDPPRRPGEEEVDEQEVMPKGPLLKGAAAVATAQGKIFLSTRDTELPESRYSKSPEPPASAASRADPSFTGPAGPPGESDHTTRSQARAQQGQA